MAARVGMTNLVQELRTWTEAGINDYTVASVTYWQDDQLQDVLDQYREDVYREPLVSHSTSDDGGTARYHDYYWSRPWVEEASGGTTVWEVEDSTGKTIGTASYTANYRAQHLYFSADQAGSAYYLTYRAYDLNRAAAAIWRRKAAHVASRYDVKVDNHDLKRSQERQMYLAMAVEYEKAAPMREVRLVRGDTAW